MYVVMNEISAATTRIMIPTKTAATILLVEYYVGIFLYGIFRVGICQLGCDLEAEASSS